MNNVVKFPIFEETSTILNTIVKKPKTQQQYLQLCKRFLTEEDYTDICVCILDKDEYTKAETYIQDIVNSYFRFKY